MSFKENRRAHGDLRHLQRKQRLQKLLAAKKKPQTQELIGDTALVIGIGPGVCTIEENGETRQIRSDFPVTPGDTVSVLHEKVAAIAPRRSILSRTDPANANRDRLIAANIDILVIVAAIQEPPLRIGLIDRYLIAAARGGIQPVLCITKVDLCADTGATEILQLPTVRCSTRTGQGIAELRDLLSGSLSVLAGHSGVGKSSLLNALASEDQAAIGSINEATGRGRHTTTSSRLYRLANGARIIDTPGIREFGLGPITAADLRGAFPEFADQPCRFSDCSHTHEPDCPVREAGGARYAAYRRLAAEL